MKLLKSLAVSAAVVSLSATPALAEAASSSKPVTMKPAARTGKTVKGNHQSESFPILPAALAVGIVAGGVIIAVSDDDSDSPDSP